MKKILAAIAVLMTMAEGGFAQTVNWRSLDDGQRNIVQFTFGYDFGVTAEVAYGRAFELIRPVLVELNYSVPMGKDLVDDLKVRLGAQIEVVEVGGFSATVKILSNFRRFHNDYVTISSFGSDFGIVAGYYSSTWHAAGEAGFDKSITSNLKHTALMREIYPAVQDGWYIPSGGNFYYGIQAGKTIGGTVDVSLRLGATSAEAHDRNPVIPFYAQLSLGLRF